MCNSRIGTTSSFFLNSMARECKYGFKDEIETQHLNESDSSISNPSENSSNVANNCLGEPLCGVFEFVVCFISIENSEICDFIYGEKRS